MLLEVIQQDFDVNVTVNDICGKEYTIISRIVKNNYGSCRYKLLQINPIKFNIDLENYTESIYLNFDLRTSGIVFYFNAVPTASAPSCSSNRP